MHPGGQETGKNPTDRGKQGTKRHLVVDAIDARSRPPVRIDPLALHPDVGLIHPPTVVGRSEARSQSALNFRAVTLDPPPDGDVVGVQAPLGQQLLDVTVRQ